MVNMEQWQRMTPKQQWDTFNALQHEHGVAAKAFDERMNELLTEAAKPAPIVSRVREAVPSTETPSETSL